MAHSQEINVKSLEALYRAQDVYLNDIRFSGSRAIALGRAAGLAQLLGNEHAVEHHWNALNGLEPAIADAKHMPSLNEFYIGYQKNIEAFEAFASKSNFSAEGTAFSNAVGSYAYALDYMRRGDVALAGGQAEWTCKWGAQALGAAGFEEQAKQFDTLHNERTKWTDFAADEKRKTSNEMRK